MNKKGEESISKYPTRNVLKRQILIDSIVTNSLLFAEIYSCGMPNVHIRGSYCMSERNGECKFS